MRWWWYRRLAAVVVGSHFVMMMMMIGRRHRLFPMVDSFSLSLPPKCSFLSYICVYIDNLQQSSTQSPSSIDVVDGGGVISDRYSFSGTATRRAPGTRARVNTALHHNPTDPSISQLRWDLTRISLVFHTMNHVHLSSCRFRFILVKQCVLA